MPVTIMARRRMDASHGLETAISDMTVVAPRWTVCLGACSPSLPEQFTEWLKGSSLQSGGALKGVEIVVNINWSF